MKIISLDQNAICNLAFSTDARWAQILSLLRRGIKAERLLCPTPAETITESVHLDGAERKKVEQLYLELGCGWFIKFFWQLIAESALALVRPGFEPTPLWLPQHLNPATE